MKKISLLLFSLMLALSSCTTAPLNDNSNENIIAEKSNETKFGIISTISHNIGNKYTHELEEKSGFIILLRSETVLLSQYVNKEVEIYGELSYDKNIPVMIVSEIKEFTDESELSWETFEIENGLKGSYLDTWTLKVVSNTVSLYTNDTLLIQISVITDDNINNIIAGRSNDTIKIGNTTGQRITSGDSSQINIYAQNFSDVFEIKYFEQEDENKDLFYDFLDKLEFNSQAPSSDNPSDDDIDLSTITDDGTDIDSLTTLDLDDLENSDNSNSNSEVGDRSSDVVEEDSSIDNTEETISTTETTTTSTDPKDSVRSYLNNNINNLIFDNELSGDFAITQYEFVEDEYVFVEFEDSDGNTRKVLYQYELHGNDVGVNEEAYFIPGDVKSWDKVSGENTVADKEKEILTVTDEGVEATTVDAGMRLYSNDRLGYNVQYPSNWYYSGYGGSGDNTHNLELSPDAEGDAGITIQMYTGTAPTTGQGSDGYYVQRGDNYFIVSGDSVYSDYIQSVAESISY